MSGHARTRIRVALVATLDAADGFAGRVVSDPSEIREADDAPWAEVVVGPEAVVHKTIGIRMTGRMLVRQLEVSATLHVRGGAEAIEKCDELTATAEAVVFSNRTLGGLLMSPLTLASIVPLGASSDGSLSLHSVRITWTCTYSTTESDASTTASS